MKAHLVDGTFELFRAFFSSPSRTSPGGVEVGAVRGLARSLLALLREPGVTHIGVAFDHEIESFRNALFEGYKTAEGIEPELLAQFPLAEQASRALGLVTWPMVEFEADDAIATAAARLAGDSSVEQVVICSPDKDLAQCVDGTRVVCYDRMRRRLLDAAAVTEKFGVAPASIPDWLALVGDAADGIPGVRRWGAKSASAVLGTYAHIERIPDDPTTWNLTVRGARGLAESLAAARDDALAYRELATLRTDVPLTESAAALRWRGPRAAELAELADLVGDARLVDDVGELAAGR